MSNFFDDQITTTQESGTNTDDQLDDNTESSNDIHDEYYTPQNIKNATQELMKYGLLEMERKPKLYQTALTHQQAINRILAPLDLSLKIDDIRGLAFLVIAEGVFTNDEGNEWNHPLIRHQRLTLEQTLLTAILRQIYVVHEQEAGVGTGGALIDIDDLKPQLFIYLEESGSEARDHARLVKLLEQLYAHGIVSEINDKSQITIRPIITHVANPETLQLLLQYLKQITTAGTPENE